MVTLKTFLNHKKGPEAGFRLILLLPITRFPLLMLLVTLSGCSIIVGVFPEQLLCCRHHILQMQSH